MRRLPWLSVRRAAIRAAWRTGRASHALHARVDDRDVTFTSDDLLLDPTPTALASLLDVPAQLARRPLEVVGPVSCAWLLRRPERARLVKAWWGRGARPLVAAPLPAAPSRPSRPTALFFSGGVDSFFTLLHHPDPVAALVFVHGFDLDIEDVARAAAFEEHLRAIAAERGMRAVVVRTDVRRHPVFAASSFERTHGGLLAAVAHLLGRHYERFLVSASYARHRDVPWGTRADLDATWSSEDVRLEHWGDAFWRREKVARVAHHPLVRRFLRVCWEGRGGELNCGVCEKCVRNRVNLARGGALEASAAFAGAPDLIASLDALPRAPESVHVAWRAFLDDPLPPPLSDAIRRLLQRSGG